MRYRLAALLLHGEQYLELRRPLPTSATLTNTARIANIYDKGSGALVLLDVNTADEQGDVVAFNRVSLFIRGLGGFGGERGPSSAAAPLPDRAPDATHCQRTTDNQALLYRLLKQRLGALGDQLFTALAGMYGIQHQGSDYRENARTGHGGHGKLNGFEFHGGSACLKVGLSMAYRPAFAKA